MKVRWTDESLRLRITPTELADVEQRRAVEMRLTLGLGGGWHVTLAAAEIPATALTQEGATLRITLSNADLARLSAPDVEGVYFPAARPDGIRYYIEKDFPCLHPRGVEALEPTTETFAAPADFEARKADDPVRDDQLLEKP
jgi:hypothetical protein